MWNTLELLSEIKSRSGENGREGRKEVRAENWYFQEDERIQKIIHEDRYQQRCGTRMSVEVQSTRHVPSQGKAVTRHLVSVAGQKLSVSLWLSLRDQQCGNRRRVRMCSLLCSGRKQFALRYGNDIWERHGKDRCGELLGRRDLVRTNQRLVDKKPQSYLDDQACGRGKIEGFQWRMDGKEALWK